MLCRYVVGYYTVCEVPSCVNVAATTCWESGAVELRSWSWTNQGGDDASRESGCEFSRWSQCSAWGELDSTQPGLLTSWLTYSLSLCVCHDVSFMLPLHWHAVDVFCCKSLLGLNLFSKTPLQQWRVRLNYHTFGHWHLLVCFSFFPLYFFVNGYQGRRSGGRVAWAPNILLKGPCINRAPPIIKLQNMHPCHSVIKSWNAFIV